MELYPKRGRVRSCLGESGAGGDNTRTGPRTILRQVYEHKPLPWIAYPARRLLIQEGKIDGENGAEHYLADSPDQGPAGGYSRKPPGTADHDAAGTLERGHRPDRDGPDCPQIDSRSLNCSDEAQLNLMLAECYRHTNGSEQRLAALQNAVDAGGNAEESPSCCWPRNYARSERPCRPGSGLETP